MVGKKMSKEERDRVMTLSKEISGLRKQRLEIEDLINQKYFEMREIFKPYGIDIDN